MASSRQVLHDFCFWDSTCVGQNFFRIQSKYNADFRANNQRQMLTGGRLTEIQLIEIVFYLSLVVSTSRQIEIEIENVLSVETNF